MTTLNLPTLNSAPPPPAPTETPWSLSALGLPAVAFVAYGEPAPQGSKTQGVSKHGKRYMRESSAKVEPWRQTVAWSAVAATKRRAAWAALDGPLVADFVFTMPKGATLPKWLWWHDKKPDLDKLTRSTGDALSGVIWTDDARVAAFRRLEKVYVGADDPDALRAPGAVIRVWRVPERMVAERKAAVRAR